ncbi:uncharacterized protein J3D65DRAFT_628469 [Phyllosticta citribraziliensis]|uniref:C3H1-type domain-containing protein n=1 Tax=Phyllosticta citribraziliensis TaxID=989973 RepID=A0ABR1LPF0_9PEZI
MSDNRFSSSRPPGHYYDNRATQDRRSPRHRSQRSRSPASRESQYTSQRRERSPHSRRQRTPSQHAHSSRRTHSSQRARSPQRAHSSQLAHSSQQSTAAQLTAAKAEVKDLKREIEFLKLQHQMEVQQLKHEKEMLQLQHYKEAREPKQKLEQSTRQRTQPPERLLDSTAQHPVPKRESPEPSPQNYPLPPQQKSASERPREAQTAEEKKDPRIANPWVYDERHHSIIRCCFHYNVYGNCQVPGNCHLLHAIPEKELERCENQQWVTEYRGKYRIQREWGLAKGNQRRQ